MFILNVIKIFFRNKWNEIKELTRTARWTDLLEVLILFIVFGLLFTVFWGLCYGIGYVIVDVLEWITLIGDTSYSATGVVFVIALFVCVGLLYAAYKFLGWAWTNIKIAIAEAKEI